MYNRWKRNSVLADSVKYEELCISYVNNGVSSSITIRSIYYEEIHSRYRALINDKNWF